MSRNAVDRVRNVRDLLVELKRLDVGEADLLQLARVAAVVLEVHLLERFGGDLLELLSVAPASWASEVVGGVAGRQRDDQVPEAGRRRGGAGGREAGRMQFEPRAKTSTTCTSPTAGRELRTPACRNTSGRHHRRAVRPGGANRPASRVARRAAVWRPVCGGYESGASSVR